jgi:integrase/recombinase XerD
MRENVKRDLGTILVSRWGRVVPSDGPVPWTVVSNDGIEVDVVQQYLQKFVAPHRFR